MRSNGPISPDRSASPTASAGRWSADLARRIVKVPDIGEGTTEAEIVAWLVKIGDTVTEEDPLAEVMTDKATVEIPSPVAGTVVALNGKVGEKLAVGSDLVVLETEAGEAAPPPPPPPPPIADAMGPPPPRDRGGGLRVPAKKSPSRIGGEGAERSAGGEGAKPLAA